MNPAKSGPSRALRSSLAPSTRWTMVWSAHQYHSPITGIAQKDRIPGQARRFRGRPQDGQLDRLDRGRKRRPAADLDEADDHDAGRAGDQDDGLDGLRQDDREKPSDDGVEAGQDGRQDDAEALIGMPNRPFSTTAPGVEREADMDEDGREDRQHRQPIRDWPGCLALLQEIGQGGDARADVEGGEDERQNEQQEGGHPLEVAVGQPVDIALLGQADQVDGGDVGREEGQADDRPAQRAAGQEVLVARDCFSRRFPRPTARARRCRSGKRR